MSKNERDFLFILILIYSQIADSIRCPETMQQHLVSDARQYENKEEGEAVMILSFEPLAYQKV